MSDIVQSVNNITHVDSASIVRCAKVVHCVERDSIKVLQLLARFQLNTKFVITLLEYLSLALSCKFEFCFHHRFK